MYYFLFIFILQFSGYYCCMATPTQDAAPEVPVLPCTTCVAPPLTGVPFAGFTQGAGRIVPGDPVGPGCVSFDITCDAQAAPNQAKAVSIGANEQLIALSAGSMGEKMATIVCNADGQLEGRTVPAGDSVIVMSIYCSNQA